MGPGGVYRASLLTIVYTSSSGTAFACSGTAFACSGGFPKCWSLPKVGLPLRLAVLCQPAAGHLTSLYQSRLVACPHERWVGLCHRQRLVVLCQPAAGHPQRDRKEGPWSACNVIRTSLVVLYLQACTRNQVQIQSTPGSGTRPIHGCSPRVHAFRARKLAQN